MCVDVKLPPQTMLVSLYSQAQDTEFLPATRDIYVGCVRTMAISQKKVCLLSNSTAPLLTATLKHCSKSLDLYFCLCVSHFDKVAFKF